MKPPKTLYDIQAWFGNSISQPLTEDQKLSNTQTIEESTRFIKPSPTLKPHERIEIYSQQYWWRVLKIMRDHFPTLASLFGTFHFNEQLAVPYLKECPPDTWNINLLGASFPKWLESHYNESDKALVINAANMDWAYVFSFLAKNYTYEAVGLSEKLVLRPGHFLFEWPYDLFNFRKAVTKEEPDYWLENEFPELNKKGPFYFSLFRNQDNNLVWVELKKAEFKLLEEFKKPLSLNELCDILESSPYKQDAEKHLASWIQKWTLKLLIIPEKKL